MFVGEGPGQREDETALPFQGQAGQFLDSLLDRIKLPRSAVFITNAVKCRPTNNRTPTPTETAFCASKWLSIEIAMVQPHILVALGAPATKYLSGSDQNMEHLHGVPMENVTLPSGYVVPILLPMYHPAFGLHNTDKIKDINSDFDHLGKLLDGVPPADITPRDEYPNPTYVEMDSPEAVIGLFNYFRERGNPVALDTETIPNPDDPDGKPLLWSVQVSDSPGCGWFIPVETWDAALGFSEAWENYDLLDGLTLVVHNYGYDAQFIDFPKFEDTMSMAYLLGLPQSLKTLARDLCGMEMMGFEDMVKPFQEDIAVIYIGSVLDHSLADERQEFEVTKWDNKAGGLVTKLTHPQTLKRKLTNMYKRTANDPELTFWKLWHEIPADERAHIEAAIGPMPEASIADAYSLDQESIQSPPYPERLGGLPTSVYYSARDADATIRVYYALLALMDEPLLQVLRDQEYPTLEQSREMMDNGMGFDVDRAKALSSEFTKELLRISHEASLIAGAYLAGIPYPFNPNSGKQVAVLLYEKLRYPVTRLTETGLPSTNEKELAKISNPLIKYILDYREVLKLLGTYSDKLPKMAVHKPEAKPNSLPGAPLRIHPTILTTRTSTGRVALRDPNLQNIPVRTALGRQIRECFISNQGLPLKQTPPLFTGGVPWGASFDTSQSTKLLAIDFSQIEMKIAMHMANCESGIRLFVEGRDIHTETAAWINGVSLQEAADPKYRYPVKRLGFGTLYMISAYGLNDQLTSEGVKGWDETRCDYFIKEYFKLYPELKTLQQETIAYARRHGYIRDMFGRVRWTPEISCPIRSIRSAGERQANNQPIQSGAQGVMKLASARIWQTYPEYWDRVYWLLQQHDELIWEVPTSMVEVVSQQFKEIMESIVQLWVPLTVSVKSGDNWASLE